MDKHACRACRGSAGHLVLDLGEQPACDYFPRSDDPGPDPAVPAADVAVLIVRPGPAAGRPTVPEEPRGTEPAALVAQAADAVARVAAAGLLPAEGGWPSTAARTADPGWGCSPAAGSSPADRGEQADVILDCFGLMHAADQHAALAERAARLAPGGVLLLQYHSLEHDHPLRPVERAAARALRVLLDDRADRHAGRGRLQPAHGLAVRPLRRHGAAGRRRETIDGASEPDDVVRSLLADDARAGVRDPGTFARPPAWGAGPCYGPA